MQCSTCLFHGIGVCDVWGYDVSPTDGCADHWPFVPDAPCSLPELVQVLDLLLEQRMGEDGSETFRIGFWVRSLIGLDEGSVAEMLGSPASRLLDYEIHVSYRGFGESQCTGIGILTVYDDEGAIVIDERYDEALESAGVISRLVAERGWK